MYFIFVTLKNMKNFLLKIILLLITVGFFGKIYSQTDDSFAGARTAAMGKTSITLQEMWSVLNNPAGTAWVDSYALGAYYENRFLMKETGFAALVFTCPIWKAGNINVGITHFGYNLFMQNKVVVGYSQKLFRNFSMGVQINYLSTRQSDFYGNANGLTFDLGLNYKPIEALSIAGYVFNPINVSYFESGELKMPVAMKLGISYCFSKKLLFAVETGKAMRGNIPVFKTGIEYLLKEHYAFRAGISLKPIEYSAGFGYKNAHLNIDIAYSYHQVLGSTPKLSIGYVF